MPRILAACMMVTALALSAPALADELGFVVVAHPDVAVDHLSPDALGRIFKKETTRWPDGTPIVPVEVGGTAPTRSSFYRATLKLVVGDVTAYWINQAMTTGNNPPKIFSSDGLVMRYVGQTPGAVGFVSPDTPADPRVKRIAIGP